METMKYSPDALVSLESVLSTVELSLRPSRPADYQAENQALVALTQELVNSRPAFFKSSWTPRWSCAAHTRQGSAWKNKKINEFGR